MFSGGGEAGRGTVGGHAGAGGVGDEKSGWGVEASQKLARLHIAAVNIAIRRFSLLQACMRGSSQPAFSTGPERQPLLLPRVEFLLWRRAWLAS